MYCIHRNDNLCDYVSLINLIDSVAKLIETLFAFSEIRQIFICFLWTRIHLKLALGFSKDFLELKKRKFDDFS